MKGTTLARTLFDQNREVSATMNNKQTILRNQKGLTLVEVLAVIVILGIIAAIAIPAVNTMIDKSRDEAHRANAQLLIDSARMYITVEDLLGGGNASKSVSAKDLVDEGYLAKLPTDPDNKGKTYSPTDTIVTASRDNDSGVISYSIVLAGEGGNKYFDGVAENEISTKDITR